MKRIVSGALPVAIVALAAVAAFAQMGPRLGQMAGGMGGGIMGPGMMGGALMGNQAGCPGMVTAGTTQTPITEERAKELAQEYADKHPKGFTVESVLPLAMGPGPPTRWT